MKKYIPIISIVVITAQGCRQADSSEDIQHDPVLRDRYQITAQSKTDSTSQEKDPPVKDGQDWRMYQ
jgi:hypothetical protein